MKLVEEGILLIFYVTTAVSRTFLSFLSQLQLNLSLKKLLHIISGRSLCSRFILKFHFTKISNFPLETPVLLTSHKLY